VSGSKRSYLCSAGHFRRPSRSWNYSDYSKSPKQIFMDASIAFFRFSQNSVPLTMACQQDNLSDLTQPSWAISTPRPVHLRALTMAYHVFNPHPCGDCRPRPRFESHGNSSVPFLEGRILDRIFLGAWKPFQGSGTSTQQTAYHF
jgi:hypothetical protein